MIEKKSKHGLMHGIRTNSLRRSFFISFALLILAVAITVIYYSYGILYKEARLYKENYLSVTKSGADRLYSLVDSSVDATKLAGYSVSCQRFLLSDNPSVIIDSMQTLEDVMSYSSIYVDGYLDMTFMADTGRRYSINKNYDVLNEALESNGLSDTYVFSKPFYYVSADKKYLVYLLPVKGIIEGHRFNYNQIIGSVVWSTDTLVKEAGIDSKYSCTTLIFYNDELICSSDEVSEETLLNCQKCDEGITSFKSNGKTVYYSKVGPNKDKISLVYIAPYELNAETTYTRDRLPILFMSLFMLLIVILMVTRIKNVEKNVTMMEEDIMHAKDELRPIRQPDIAELRVISDVINNTFTALDKSYARETRLIQDNYEALLAQTRAELLAYRNQINPHFLFNTLETARSLSRHYGAKQVEDLISGMSKLFRYALYTPSESTYEDELENLRAYISVMDIRFPGRYQLNISADESLLRCSVMSMLLQPIVENTIKHAFDGKPFGKILVKIKECNGNVTILVADNGQGMPESKITEIMGNCETFRNQYSEETTYGKAILMDSSVTDKNIGIINIFRRLIITYREKADLKIKSKEGYYTAIEITVPKGESKK